ncbi:uncharacterized protein LOC131227773 isoform X2 [Magnolia sinica]|uniref:uncharacterized protein LOC131227773 isoform X2 n=1 Tax=Magnolia sinica TaxID=86752 RepID=UPI00265B25E3|nr:uncharacterized protein LOC131227773 isoform X2 [Magnolia sinica]
MISVSTYQFSGSIQPSLLKLPFPIQRFKEAKLVTRGISSNQFWNPFRSRLCIKCAVSGRSNRELRSEEDRLRPEPFWSTLIKEAFWGLRSLLVFLFEQPSQLRYIEWPSFQSTLRTATLTLVIVALLIVALSSIDSALCYLLTLLLRRTA